MMFRLMVQKGTTQTWIQYQRTMDRKMMVKARQMETSSLGIVRSSKSEFVGIASGLRRRDGKAFPSNIARELKVTLLAQTCCVTALSSWANLRTIVPASFKTPISPSQLSLSQGRRPDSVIKPWLQALPPPQIASYAILTTLCPSGK